MASSTQGAAPDLSCPVFDFDDIVGEAVALLTPVDESTLRRAIDPESAAESIHWGRNYLYATAWATPSGPLSVVVKQFRNAGPMARLRRRLRGTKARKAFRVACRLRELGIGTPEPLLYAESRALEGPAFFITRHLEGRLETRYLLRSLDAGTAARDYPDLDIDRVFRAFGELVRTLHEGKVWHRDLSCGNLLIEEAAFQRGQGVPGSFAGVAVLDLNRARVGPNLTLSERMRDLSRLEVPAAQMVSMWAGYWREDDGVWRMRVGHWLRETYRRSFLVRNRSKKSVRGFARRLNDLLMPRRRPHAHIPSSEATSVRDKIVWDRLSDQPHQHASKLEKLRVRITDSPQHARLLAAAVRAYPAIKRRHQELEAERFGQATTMEGFGLCVRPWSDDPDAVLEAVCDLGVKHVLIRLHPWQETHEAELLLAGELCARGIELVFALPQSRALVRDLETWRRRVAELARSFAPLGRTFQVGQAVNRSKWGVWKPSEYVALFAAAAEEIRAVRPDALLLGPAVIDFEFHQTAGYLNQHFAGSALDLDGLASLLYVDRRGAPENLQLGLDVVGKAAFLRAIVDTSVALENKPTPAPNWITEVNWPLWEGPHSPAGRDVAVSEQDQAHYLARYYLLVLASGYVERVYWWQLIAKGYGLIDWTDGVVGSGAPGFPRTMALRRRPAFHALATLVRELAGATFEGPVGTAGEGQYLLRFTRHGETLVAGWRVKGGRGLANLPAPVEFVAGRCGLDGVWQDHAGGRRAQLTEEVQLFRIQS